MWSRLSGFLARGRSFDELDYGIPVEQRSVGGYRLAVHEAGRGDPPLVLIHGLGSDMRVWSENLAALSARHRVVAFDLLGFGRSDKPAGVHALADHVACVRELIDGLGGAAILVGHSMGGQIALRAALSYPERVLGLVLAAPAGLERFDPAAKHWIRAVVDDGYTRYASPLQVAMRHAQTFHRPPPAAWAMLRDRLAVIDGPEFGAYCRAVTQSVAAMLAEPVFDELEGITAPTLVTFGRHDALIPNRVFHGRDTERLARHAVGRIPGARLEMIPDAGHMPQLEQPNHWNSLALDLAAAPSKPPR